MTNLASGVALWIDVRDASNNKLGPGPLTEIARWRSVPRMSRAGDFSVEFPATYLRLHELQIDGNPLLHTDRYLYCYGILNGAVTLLGTGIVKEIELTRSAGSPPMITASGPDVLGELRRTTVRTVYRPWQYDINDSATAPEDLLTTFAVVPYLPDDWLFTGSATLANITAKFVHASLLGALVDIGSKIGEHFRIGSANNGRELVWLGPQSTMVDCGVRAELSADLVAAEGNDDICLITAVAEIKDSWDLHTMVFGFGAGQGHDRLDLSAVSLWPDGHRLRCNILSIAGDGLFTTTIAFTENHDFSVGEELEIVGTQFFDGTYLVDAVVNASSIEIMKTSSATETYTGAVFGPKEHTIDGIEWRIDWDQTYLENVTARLAYGRHHTALQFKEISPLSNSDADVTHAANALLLAMYNWLRTRSATAKFYRLSVAKLNQLIYPGQTMRVVAKGFVEGAAYLNIDQDLIILEPTFEVDANGVRTTSLVVATTDRWPASDGEQAAQEFRQADIYQSLAQLGPSVDTISYREYIDDDYSATFPFFLGEATTIVNQVIVRFRTDKLRSTVKSVGGTSSTTSSGGGTTATSSSGGGSSPTSASGGGATVTSDSGSGHTHEIPLGDSAIGSPVYFAGVGTPPTGDLRTSGGGVVNASSTGSGHSHEVNVPDHTHAVTVPAHTHDVTVPDHTHSLTASVSTEYGIYEDPGTAYAATDLEFSVNGGAWRSDYAGISGATGWYALDVTSAVVATGLRPKRVANSVEVRVKVASQADKKAQITVQIERRTVIQSIANV